MTEPSYPAAHAVAPKIQAHFARYLAAIGARAVGALPLAPDTRDIEALVDAAFWASLRREEGFVPKISLALLPAERASEPMLFARPLPLAPVPLVRVAPAVERPGIHLGVWRSGGDLEVWGTTRTIPPFCVVLEVAAPGLLVVKHHRGDGGKFVNVAVIEGDHVKIIDEAASSMPDCPALLTTLLGLDTAGSWHGSTNVLVELAVSMRAHGRGGSMLMTPSGTDNWRDSIVQPMLYHVLPPFSALADLIRRPREARVAREWQDNLADTVKAVAGLTAVDGAALLTDQFDLLAFGAKISRARGRPLVEQVVTTEPIEGVEAEVVHPSRLGGTRHLSAAQFVQDQRDAIALVASQDGRFTVFAWSPSDDMVHAHRVETLLL
ncbi:MAG: hypothetical protein GEU82_16460 [Luteitalea sp.]|nr:hypothetical protein [Luteitalea sp.]